MFRRFAIACLLLLICGTALAEKPWYLVREGDTLEELSRDFGLPIDVIRFANELPGDTLQAGLHLALFEPVPRHDGHIDWQPAIDASTGEIVQAYDDANSATAFPTRNGIDIAVPRGTRLVAPAAGVIRFLGPLNGYGHALFLDHGGNWATVFGPLDADTLSVVMGQAVRAGDELGFSGAPVTHDHPYLHIELRRGNETLDPSPLLP